MPLFSDIMLLEAAIGMNPTAWQNLTLMKATKERAKGGKQIICKSNHDQS